MCLVTGPNGELAPSYPGLPLIVSSYPCLPPPILRVDACICSLLPVTARHISTFTSYALLFCLRVYLSLSFPHPIPLWPRSANIYDPVCPVYSSSPHLSPPTYLLSPSVSPLSPSVSPLVSVCLPSCLRLSRHPSLPVSIGRIACKLHTAFRTPDSGRRTPDCDCTDSHRKPTRAAI